MKPKQLALAAHVDQMVRNAGMVKGESDDNHRVERNDRPRVIGCEDGRGSTRTNRSKLPLPLLHVGSGATRPASPPMIYVNGISRPNAQALSSCLFRRGRCQFRQAGGKP